MVYLNINMYNKFHMEPVVNVSEQQKQLELLKKIRTSSIVSLVLIFTIIGVIATIVLDIINAIRILSTIWVRQDVEDNKLIWGIFTIIILGPISSLIFACISISKYENNVSV